MSESCDIGIWNRGVDFSVVDVPSRNELERVVENIRIVHDSPVKDSVYEFKIRRQSLIHELTHQLFWRMMVPFGMK
jgi:hypothetical protein